MAPGMDSNPNLPVKNLSIKLEKPRAKLKRRSISVGIKGKNDSCEWRCSLILHQSWCSWAIDSQG
jgi:hypothetical protein